MPESVQQNLVEALTNIINRLDGLTADEVREELKNCKDMAVEIRDFMERND